MAVLPHFPTLRLSRERKPNAFPLHSPFSAAAQSSQKPAASDLSSRTISCSSHSPVSRNASQSSTLTSSLVYLSRKEKPAPGFSGSADLLRIFAFLTFPLLKIYRCVCVCVSFRLDSVTPPGKGKELGDECPEQIAQQGVRHVCRKHLMTEKEPRKRIRKVCL